MRAPARRWSRVLPVGAALAGSVLFSSAAQADTNPYQRGPDPTTASVAAARGSFAIAQVSVLQGSGTGFNDGTIYYPTDTSQGTFGAIVVMPGFLSPQSSIQWYGPMLASRGFVVMTMDSQSWVDGPIPRSQQQLAALTYLTTRSQVRSEIDPSRLAVMGWSMGGGGSLESEAADPSLKAGIGLAPWDVSAPSPQIKTPTMIIGATGDFIAPVASFAQPLYAGISGTDKALVELSGGSHFTFTGQNSIITRYVVSWMKRFVDSDTRYEQFLCPTPATGGGIALLQDTCPL